MNWHQTNMDGIYLGSKRMYPDHEALLSFLHNDRGLYVGANLHDAQGIMPVENEYKAMANYLKQSDGKTLTFHVSNKSYVDDYTNWCWNHWQQMVALISGGRIGNKVYKGCLGSVQLMLQV